MDRLYFNIKDFCITGDKVPIRIADKIMNNFIVPLSKLRSTVIDFPIYVSMNSGYRPPHYEKEKQRSTKGVHTFIGMGASDLACESAKKTKELYHLLLKYSKFEAICYYPNAGFIHVDYEKRGHRKYIDKSDGKGWQRI